MSLHFPSFIDFHNMLRIYDVGYVAIRLWCSPRNINILECMLHTQVLKVLIKLREVVDLRVRVALPVRVRS